MATARRPKGEIPAYDAGEVRVVAQRAIKCPECGRAVAEVVRYADGHEEFATFLRLGSPMGWEQDPRNPRRGDYPPVRGVRAVIDPPMLAARDVEVPCRRKHAGGVPGVMVITKSRVDAEFRAL